MADLVVIPRDCRGPAAVIEIEEAGDDDTEAIAERALEQEVSKRYAIGIHGDPIRMYGVSFGTHEVSMRMHLGNRK